MFWGLIAFVLVLFLVVILWVVSIVRSQKQAQIQEAKREYEVIPQSTYDEQHQAQQPKEEVLTKR